MARKPRIEYEGAFYHVITRGNWREKIFRDKRDFLKYLEIVSNYKKRHQFRLYSFVLMSNHIHLLIETGGTPLSKIQQGINQSYTMYFNRRYKMVGHLFQGRYKAILCDRDAYLLSLVKYIHMNPLRAKMVQDLNEYKWSSHQCYADKGQNNGLVDTDRVLRMFSEDRVRSKELYREFMGDGLAIKREEVYRTVEQRVLGSEEFLDNVMEKYDVEFKNSKREREYSLRMISEGVEKITGVTLKQIHGKSKFARISTGRKLLILAAKEYGYKGKEIGEYIKRDPAIISIVLKDRSRYKEEMGRVIGILKKLNI
ncbi:MAG: transposase [Nitrospiraceae bacterium]|nr:MAG: transposase [Nitrospiraceae bacterium]